MTFRDVLKKNFIFNIKNYSIYFFCFSLCVSISFMYANLFYNNLQSSKGNYFHMTVCFIVLIIFIFLIISYFHYIFIKSRIKEFKTYLVLGLNSKSIYKIIKYEIQVISLLSLLFGIIAGSLYSRIFVMIILKLLNLKLFTYRLDYRSYVFTLSTFFILYIVIIYLTKINIRKIDITKDIDSKSFFVQINIKRIILGLIGVIFITLSFIILNILLKYELPDQYTYQYIVCLVLLLVGTYLFIKYFGTIILLMIKKSKKYYYANLIKVSMINHKINEYSKIIYILTLLTITTIILNGHSFVLFNNTNEEIDKICPYDLMFITDDNNEDKNFNELVHIHVNTTDKKEVSFVYMDLNREIKNVYNVWSSNIPVFCESEVNNLFNTNIDVKPGYFISCLSDNKVCGWIKYDKTIGLESSKDKKTYVYKLQKIIQKAIINNKCNCLIIDDEDYYQILRHIGNNQIYNAYLYNFKNSQVAKDINNRILNLINCGNLYSKNVYSKSLRYEDMLRENKEYLFTTIFIGVLCVISICILLYSKISLNMNCDKELYTKLIHVGICDNELRSIAFSVVNIVIFVPVVLGSIISCVYLIIIDNVYFIYKNTLSSMLMVIVVYILINYILYILYKKKYNKFLSKL